MHAGIRLRHWRDGSAEVDLIYDDPHQPVAFEIALSASHHRKGLRDLLARHERLRGHSYLVAPQAAVLPAGASESGVGTLPVDLFLHLIGRQAETARARSFGPAGSPPG